MDTLIDDGLSIKIIRTKRRKTASIIIADGLVKAVVPDQISDFTIKELVRKRMPWIRKKLQDKSYTTYVKPKEYVDGENFLYLGDTYQLQSFISDLSSVDVTNSYISVSLPKQSKESIKDLMTHWYVEKATEILTEKTGDYAKIIGVLPHLISVRDFKSKWGSCSIEGKISYNWRIVMAPHRILDYVVIHELCHMLEHNHSKEYWLHVSTYCHDFKECRKWLRLNAKSLAI